MYPRAIKTFFRVGAPIRVPHLHPSHPLFDPTVSRIHLEYCRALVALHQKFWPQYGYPQERNLRFVSSKEAKNWKMGSDHLALTKAKL